MNNMSSLSRDLKSHQRADVAILWIAALGLALRLGGAWLQANVPPEADAADYAGIAQNLVHARQFALVPGVPTARRPPLYPLFLTPFVALCSAPWVCARVAQAFLDASVCFFVYGLAWLALRRRREALIAAFLYAVHPAFIAYSGRILTEVLFFWVWAAAMWLMLRALEPEASSLPRSVWAGGALGAAILCRPTAIAFPVFAAAVLWCVHRHRRKIGARLSVMVAVAYLAVVPWAMRNRIVFGQWVPVATGGGVAFWVGTQTGAYPDWQGRLAALQTGRTDTEVDQEFYRLAKDEYSRKWPRILLDIPRREIHFWLTSHSSLFGVDRPASEYRREGRWGALIFRILMWVLQLALLAAGAWGVWLMRPDWSCGCTLFLAVVFYYNLHVLIDYGPNRYHLPALMLWFVFASRTARELRA
jgi:4-amino-4-deoxy-L-arabinose transferase-like glycosyltransferase